MTAHQCKLALKGVDVNTAPVHTPTLASMPAGVDGDSGDDGETVGDAVRNRPKRAARKTSSAGDKFR